MHQLSLRSLLVGMILLVLSACQSEKYPKEQLQYFADRCTSPDSIVRFFVSLDEPVSHSAPYCFTAFSRFFFAGQDSLAEAVLLGMEKTAQNGDSLWYYYATVNRLSRAMLRGDDSAFQHELSLAKGIYTVTDTAILVQLYNAIGSQHFEQQRLDLAGVAFQKGFKLAESTHNEYQRMQLASNLGTYYFYKNSPGLATYYFSLGVEAMKRGSFENPMLLNNVISALGNEDRHQESYEFYQLNKSLLNKAKDKNTQQTIALNYAYVLCNLGKDAEQGEILENNPFDELSLHLKMDWLSIKLRHCVIQRDWNQAREVQKKFEPFIKENSPWILLRLAPALVPLADSGHMILSWSLMEKELERGLKDGELDNEDARKFLELLQSGPFSASKKAAFRAQYKDLHYAYLQQSDSMRFSNIQAVLSLNELRRNQEQLEDRIENERESNNWFRIIAVLIGLILFMAIVNLLQWKRDRNRDLLSLSEQLAWETERKESLEKEQAYTEKIRVLSETLISKSIRWIELIRKSEFANDPNGIQLRRELETLVSFKSGVNAEIPILERDKAVEEALASFPELEDLSHTAKEAIILSVSGHKAKEIARLLDINEQYVRNLKSTAKRKLTPRFGSKFRWEDLPKLIQET